MGNRPLFDRTGPALQLAAIAAGLAGLAWTLLGATPSVALAVFLITMSGGTFLLFVIDKHRAIGGRRRVSESSLLWGSFLGGAGGGLVAMFLVRHKTRNVRFRVLVPLFFAAQVVGLAYLFDA